MPENDYITLKEALSEVKDGNKEILQSLNDFKVLCTEKFATKIEVKEVDTKIENIQSKTRGMIFGIATLTVAIIGLFITYFK